MKQQIMQSQLISSANEQVFCGSPSLAQAIGQLPRQYIKVLCRPSVQTFREEMSNASWQLAVIQVCMLVMLTLSLSALAHLIPFAALHTTVPLGWVPSGHSLFCPPLSTQSRLSWEASP